MGRILVFFGTTNGHTATIARSVADTLRQHGGSLDVIEAGTGDPRPEDYAAVVVAASVSAGKYQRPVRRWVRTHAHALNRRPTAFISVCLGVLQQKQAVQQAVAAIMMRFLTAAERVQREVPGAGGSPAHGAQVA